MRSLTRAVVIKFLLVTTLVYVTTGLIFHWHFELIILISFFVTAISFVLSDLVLLPAGGNLPASLIDWLLSLIGSWAVATIFTGGANISIIHGPFFSATAIGTAEWLFFHKYLLQIGLDH